MRVKDGVDGFAVPRLLYALRVSGIERLHGTILEIRFERFAQIVVSAVRQKILVPTSTLTR